MKTKVLFIDDDLMTAEWVSLYLASNEIEIKTANSIRAAIDCLNIWLPDLIVSDLSLNGDNAFSLLNHLASNERMTQIPVVAVTGYSLPASEREKFHGYLMKPISPEQLLKMIEQLLPERPGGELNS